MELFSKTHGFKSLRLVKNYKNQSKGYAYIDFNTTEQAIKAQNQWNGFKLLNKSIHFLVSKPTKEIYQQTTLFIRYIPSDLSEEELINILNQNGIKGIVSARIVKHSDNNDLRLCTIILKIN